MFCSNVKFVVVFALQSVLYMDLYTKQDILFQCQVFGVCFLVCFVCVCVCVFCLVVCIVHGPLRQLRHSVPVSSFVFGLTVCTIHGPTNQPRHSVPMPSFGLAFCLFVWALQSILSSVKFLAWLCLQSVLYMDLHSNQDFLFQCQVVVFCLIVCTVHGPVSQTRCSDPMGEERKKSFSQKSVLFCPVHGPVQQPGCSVLVSSFLFCFALQSVLYMDLYTNQDVLF